MAYDPILDPLFVESFNADLAEIGSLGRIAITNLPECDDMFELLDDEGQFLTLLPRSAAPDVTAAAYNLYAQGLNKGLREGEQRAWARLRDLIGAAPAQA